MQAVPSAIEGEVCQCTAERKAKDEVMRHTIQGKGDGLPEQDGQGSGEGGANRVLGLRRLAQLV